MQWTRVDPTGGSPTGGTGDWFTTPRALVLAWCEADGQGMPDETEIQRAADRLTAVLDGTELVTDPGSAKAAGLLTDDDEIETDWEHIQGLVW